jgi:two-component system KDP operon response regulator KdpE
MRILVVDDDAHIREAVAVGLQLHWPDAEILLAKDGEEGLDLFFGREPDVVLLDVAMPGKNGFEVLREIRRVSDVPVILLTARGEEADQVRGLGMGADDYVVKPFSHLALLARIQAIRRRAEMAPVHDAPEFVAGPLAVDFGAERVTLGGEPVELTPVEYKLLYHLVRNAGHLMTHRALLDRVWGADYGASVDYLKVFVSRLRHKIEPAAGPRFIETERGLGYRFVRPQEPERA